MESKRYVFGFFFFFQLFSIRILLINFSIFVLEFKDWTPSSSEDHPLDTGLLDALTSSQDGSKNENQINILKIINLIITDN